MSFEGGGRGGGVEWGGGKIVHKFRLSGAIISERGGFHAYYVVHSMALLR